MNRWIVAELAGLAGRVDEAVAGFRFDLAASDLYQFTWGTFCDWYLEFIKPLLLDGDEATKMETRATAGWALDQILKLLHPFMPFITEELWGRLSDDRETMLIVAPWPEFGPEHEDEAARDEMGWVIRLISRIRATRTELNVPAGAKIPALMRGVGETTLARLDSHGTVIGRLARLETITVLDGAPPPGSAQLVVDGATIALPLAGVMDIAAERARLKREIEKAKAEIAAIDQRLSNKGFVEKAPAHVVEVQHERRAEAEEKYSKLAAAFARLPAD